MTVNKSNPKPNLSDIYLPIVDSLDRVKDKISSLKDDIDNLPTFKGWNPSASLLGFIESRIISAKIYKERNYAEKKDFLYLKIIFQNYESI